MTFCMLINLKLLTIANSYSQNLAEQDNFSANKFEKCQILMTFFKKLLAEKLSCSTELNMKKRFIILGSGSYCSSKKRGKKELVRVCTF